jgi:hypothetical protein
MAKRNFFAKKELLFLVPTLTFLKTKRHYRLPVLWEREKKVSDDEQLLSEREKKVWEHENKLCFRPKKVWDCPFKTKKQEALLPACLSLIGDTCTDGVRGITKWNHL